MRKVYLVYLILILFTQKVNAQIVSNYAGTGVAGSAGDSGLAIDAEINNGSKDYDKEYIRKHVNKLTS